VNTQTIKIGGDKSVRPRTHTAQNPINLQILAQRVKPKKFSGASGAGFRLVFSPLSGHQELHHQALLAAGSQDELAMDEHTSVVFQTRDCLGTARFFACGLEREAVEHNLLAVEGFSALTR
jgi:hypothetical protein